jgi:hypothetical protein
LLSWCLAKQYYGGEFGLRRASLEVDRVKFSNGSLQFILFFILFFYFFAGQLIVSKWG